jgi:acyl-CoA thioesterase FadM
MRRASSVAQIDATLDSAGKHDLRFYQGILNADSGAKLFSSQAQLLCNSNRRQSP